MPTAFRRFARRVRALLHGHALNQEVSAEMRLHLELEAEELVRSQGLSPAEARRRAAVAFGGVSHHMEGHRDARGVRWFEDLGQDMR
jgi:hypothetical protein